MIKIAYLLLASSAALFGQTFEVASVKPGDPNSPGTMIKFPNGTFTATGITAQNCIALAYDIPSYQLTGGPSWIGNLRYDIDAKMPAAEVKAPADPGRVPQMKMALRALLADRFQLAVHRETKVMPAYTLVAAKGGFKLNETKDDGHGSFSSGRGKFQAKQISMELLARNLSGILGSPVADLTGLKGVFDVTLEWAPDSNEAADLPAGPSIFTALQEQLGLKLETRKTPMEMVVIDKIEKPSGN